MEIFPKNLHDLIVPFGLLANIVSSILIIQLNKYIYVEFAFPNMTLTCIHFIVTFFGLLICNRLGVFKRVDIPFVKMLPMALTFCGFVVLTNYSLQYNAIGTYQCLKIMTIPGVMLISVFYYKHSYSLRVRLSIIPVLLGVFFNSMYDLSFNIDGLVIGLVGAAVTSLYQVWIGEKQKEFKVNALQLLLYQAPLSSLLLMVTIPFFESAFGEGSILDPDREYLEWFLVFLSGIVAFVVNLSIYWVIGTTSALTYNMIGNVKFVTTIIIGAMIFEDKFTFQQVLALLSVLCGLVSYTYYKIKEGEATSKQTASSAPLLSNEINASSSENL